MNIGGPESPSRMRMFGLGSGLDIDDIVKQLMDAERIPLNRMLQQKQLLEWKREEYRNLRTRLNNLRSTAFNMGLSTAYRATVASSSDESIVTVTSSVGAPPGTYSITVKQLADVVQVHSGQITAGEHLLDQFSGLGESITFEIVKKGAAGDEVKSFTFDTASTTLSQVIAAINNSGIGLSAFYDSTLGRVFITGKETGSAQQYEFRDISGSFLTGSDGLNLVYTDTTGTEQSVAGQIVAGKDAIFDLNGAQNLKQATNSFVINGVTYNLRRADAATSVVVRVDRDVDSVIANIKSFINQYNETLAVLNAELKEKRYLDFQPLTDEQKKELSETEIARWEEKARSGLLRADPIIRDVVLEMRAAMTGPVDGADSTYRLLSELGIETKGWIEGGILHITDEAKLRKALTEDPDAVMKLFSQSGETASTKGIALRLRDAMDKATKMLAEHAGTIDMVVDDSFIGKSIKALDERVAIMEDRLARREEYYYRQFSALERLTSQSAATSAWLAQQFGGM